MVQQRAGITAETPVQFQVSLPAETDVVVIGGGVIGVMTAWFLRERGQRVVLCEKGRVAGEQSSRNWGWVRQQGRDWAELPIMMEANRIWQGLKEEAGEDLGFRQTGVLYIATKPRDMARYEKWMELARQHQLDTRILTAAEVRAKFPEMKGDCLGGLWTASDARAEPWVAVPSLAREAARRGVVIAEDCAVRCLDIAAGRVAGVVTEKGRIRCDRVVLAGGAWSSLFLRNHGASIPQLSVRASVCATEPLPDVFAGNGVRGQVAWRRRADGGYSLAPGWFHDVFVGPDSFRHLRVFMPQMKDELSGKSRFLPRAPAGYPDAWGTPRKWSGEEQSPFERMRVLDPAPNMKKLDQIRAGFQALFPAAGEVRLARAWAGMIDAMPDEVPIVDHVPGIPGLTLATGMSGHGFGIGPGMGRVVADMVMGRDPGHDMRRFHYTRFTDGTPFERGPQL